MTLQDVFNRMVSGKQVRLTKEGREYWTKDMIVPNIGQWFTITSVHSDGSVRLVGELHDMFENLDIKYITF